jgi:tetratricopeptide (TPR) repeat protein
LIWSSLLFAQDAPDTAPADREDAVKFTEADFETILGDMTTEDMEQIVQAAARRCLEVERRQAAAEIRENLLYDETAVQNALKILEVPATASSTRRENIERICRAFATVDERFAEANKLYRQKQYDKAAKRLKDSLNSEDASYFSAAVHFLYADCLIRQDKLWPGVETYSDLLVNLPGRISFATDAVLRAAKAYERMGRNLYAMQMYAYCLNNYALTMDKEELTNITERYEQLQSTYRDPVSSLAGMLAHIHERLGRKDVGEGTQQRQKDVVALLEDLIKTHEEKQRSDKNNQPGSDKGRRKGDQDRQDQARRDGSTTSAQPAGTPRHPTVGATESVLVPGPVSRPNKLAKIHAGGDVGAWAELPPRQKAAVRNLMRRRLAERRGQMVRDYHRKLAEGE